MKHPKKNETPGAHTVTLMAVADLLPYAANARTHSAEQVTRIAASIKEFGFNNPILIDGAKGVIAGHGRLEAAKKLDLVSVPVIELTHLTDAQKRAYILADNRIAIDAGWDGAMLSAELQRLTEDAFDVTLTGFSQGELNTFLGTVTDFEPNLPDADDEKSLGTDKLELRIAFDDEDTQQMLFLELRDRGFKVKV